MGAYLDGSLGGRRIDTMIAAIAINRKAKIYTFNKKHFQSFKQIQLFVYLILMKKRKEQRKRRKN